MKTRTLMLLALGCGVVIMLAGAVFLFQLATQDELVEPAPIGVVTDVGDMAVTVFESQGGGDGSLAVRIEIGGTVDSAPAENFRMIASGRPAPLLGTTCVPTGVEPQTCVMAFDVSSADGSSRVLFYERGDEQARWVLGG
jgi:hypothetical protein